MARCLATAWRGTGSSPASSVAVAGPPSAQRRAPWRRGAPARRRRPSSEGTSCPPGRGSSGPPPPNQADSSPDWVRARHTTPAGTRTTRRRSTCPTLDLPSEPATRRLHMGATMCNHTVAGYQEEAMSSPVPLDPPDLVGRRLLDSRIVVLGGPIDDAMANLV